METETIGLLTPFTRTKKADTPGALGFSTSLYVTLMTFGAVFSITELIYTGPFAATLFVTGCAPMVATTPPAGV